MLDINYEFVVRSRRVCEARDVSAAVDGDVGRVDIIGKAHLRVARVFEIEQAADGVFVHQIPSDLCPDVERKAILRVHGLFQRGREEPLGALESSRVLSLAGRLVPVDAGRQQSAFWSLHLLWFCHLARRSSRWVLRRGGLVDGGPHRRLVESVEVVLERRVVYRQTGKVLVAGVDHAGQGVLLSNKCLEGDRWLQVAEHVGAVLVAGDGSFVGSDPSKCCRAAPDGSIQLFVEVSLIEPVLEGGRQSIIRCDWGFDQ